MLERARARRGGVLAVLLVVVQSPARPLAQSSSTPSRAGLLASRLLEVRLPGAGVGLVILAAVEAVVAAVAAVEVAAVAEGGGGAPVPPRQRRYAASAWKAATQMGTPVSMPCGAA